MNEIAKLIIDNYNNDLPTKFEATTKADRDNMIRQEILGVMGLQQFDAKAVRKALRNPAVNVAVFEIIENVITEGILKGTYKNEFFDNFVETKTIDAGDKNEYYVAPRHQLVCAEFSGSHWDLKRQRIDVGQTISTEMRDFGIKVYEYLERVLAGRCDFVELVNALQVAVDQKLREISYATFAALLNRLPETFSLTGSFDEAEVLELASHIEADAGEITFVGTKVALNKLQGKVTLPASDAMKNERNQKGYVSLWNGYRCVEIAQQHKLGTLDFMMSNDEIYVIAGDTKPVKMSVTSGLIQENSGYQNHDMSMEYTYVFQAGVAVVLEKAIGKITLA